jgi:transcriptional regulator with GAF, ATPase, and Fis domain
MRGEQDIAQLADNVIHYLCRYLEAQIGALFVLDGTGDRLELAGSYAHAGDGHGSIQFELGEGLVGQAVLEGRTLALNDIPAEELTITSALGQHAPRHILILPLLYENRAAGAVELGTLSRFSTAQLEFLDRATNDVAIAFHTAQTRKQVNDLLIQTQQQAEELQAQEEELRAINEELQAQAESLQAQHQPRSGASEERSR